ncbi:MAG TPA: glycosyltransferase family 87 protein [Streptosporangiaceae bacterium]
MTARRITVIGPVAAALTALVYFSVNPGPALARLGPLPLAAPMWAAFVAGVWLVRRAPLRWSVAIIVLGGIAVQAAALSAPPQRSTDLYRYIWDGQVQAAGIDPYQYVPAAPELASLRDPFLWPADGHFCVPPGARAAGHGEPLDPGCTRINRPTVPTIYPPVAEAYFLTVRKASPPGGGSLPIQAGAAAAAIATTLLLLAGLRSLGRDMRLAVLWAWCPAVSLEAGNNGHVDVVAACLTAGALWALARAGPLRRMGGGALLGLAITAKITPLLVAPALLRGRRWPALASAALAVTGLVYLPHIIVVGSKVIGFFPGYLREEGYDTGSRFALIGLAVPGRAAVVAAVGVLGAVAALVARHGDPDRPWRGALVMTGAALLVTTPPFPWYALLLVMLAGFDGRAEWLALAAARYPFGQVAVGYGLALAVIAAVSLARAYSARGMLPSRLGPLRLAGRLVSDPGGPAPGLPHAPGADAPTHAATAAHR